MLIQEGINIDPVLHSTGIRMGQSLYNKLYDDDLEVFIENIAEFWETKGLGKLSFKLGQIIKITASDCFECELPVRVIEIQCCTMGDENCVFEIEPFKRK